MTTKTKSIPAADADNAAAPHSPSTTSRPGSKIAKVIAMLERDAGATLEEMTKATGWQPHSARAALTGLKKKGFMIAKTKRDDATYYSIAAIS